MARVGIIGLGLAAIIAITNRPIVRIGQAKSGPNLKLEDTVS